MRSVSFSLVWVDKRDACVGDCYGMIKLEGKVLIRHRRGATKSNAVYMSESEVF